MVFPLNPLLVSVKAHDYVAVCCVRSRDRDRTIREAGRTRRAYHIAAIDQVHGVSRFNASRKRVSPWRHPQVLLIHLGRLTIRQRERPERPIKCKYLVGVCWIVHEERNQTIHILSLSGLHRSQSEADQEQGDHQNISELLENFLHKNYPLPLLRHCD